MPAIVLEGRDESGKSTLAHKLIDRTPIKSPAGKSGDWVPQWSFWAQIHANGEILSVLDRTPEISELVYGTARGSVRDNDAWDARIAGWRRSPIFLVFCFPHSDGLVGNHVDAEGNQVTDKYIEAVDFGYRMLYHLLLQVQSTKFWVRKYSYDRDPDAADLRSDIYTWRNLL